MSLHGSTETSAFAFAILLAAPNQEASDEEVAIKASNKGPFDASPTMSIIGEPSPSIAQTNKMWSSEQIRSSEGEIVRVVARAVSKCGVEIRITPQALYIEGGGKMFPEISPSLSHGKKARWASK
jgi:5-enolpyruvylshikimate-3-phosphate synthase